MTLSNLRPTTGKLVVTKPIPLEEAGERQLPGGLLAPSRADIHRRQYGVVCEVLKVAGDVYSVQPGQRVIVGEFAGTPIHAEGIEQPFWLIGEGHIIAVVEV